MPNLYKNEYYDNDGFKFYSLDTKPVYAVIFDKHDQFIKKFDTQEVVIELDQVRNAGNDLHFVRSTKIESYYYLYNNGDNWYTLYIDGNFVFRSSVNDVVDKMQWIATQAPLTYEMGEMILKVMGQGACKRHEIIDLIYWHLRAIERVRNGNNER